MPTHERLDRCFVNAEWCNGFPNTDVYNLPIMYSDHATILAISTPSKNEKNQNWWLFEDDYHDAARNNWITTNDKPHHVRTALLVGTLKKWSRSKRPLKQQLNTIHKDLEMIQSTHTQLQDHNLKAILME